MKLFSKLLLLLLPAIVFLFVAILSSFYYITKGNVEQQIKEGLNAVADLRMQELKVYLEYTRQQMLEFNSRLALLNMMKVDRRNGLSNSQLVTLDLTLLHIQSVVSAFDRILLVAPHGTIIADTQNQLQGQTYSQFQHLLDMEKDTYIARRLPRNEQGMNLQHAVKLTADKSLLGYVVVNTRANLLQDFLFSNIGLGRHGNVLLLHVENDSSVSLVIDPANVSDKTSQISELEPYIEHLSDTFDYEFQYLNGETYIAHQERFNDRPWILITQVKKDEAYAVLHEIRDIGIVGTLFVSLFVSLGLVLFARHISKPIEKLESEAHRALENNQIAHFENVGIQEFDQLSETLNYLVGRQEEQKGYLEISVARRTSDLSLKNNELQRILNELQETQNLLVETEKMAALGEMVAGMAHEVNTPIGSALGAATYLQENSQNLVISYNEGELTEELFKEHIEVNLSSAEIVVHNIQRATDLIRSFKRVAVDQSNENIVEFELVEYIRDVILSLKPTYKSIDLSFNFTGLEMVRVRQVPGAIAQIVSNIIVNAVYHAFDESKTGKIGIDLSISGEKDLLLVMSDDGKGMPARVLSRLFDPFFTTKRGAGGTGLGMHIVYNLVSNNLEGKIRAESAISSGCRFFISFPLTNSKVMG